MQYADIFQSSDAKIMFLKGLIRLAKADNVIDPREKAYFRTIGTYLDLSEEELNKAEQYWTQDSLPVTFETMPEKILFVREALQLCAIDDDYAEEEKQEMRKVCAELGVSNETLEKLEAWVEEGMDWKRRGDAFLSV